MRLLRIHVIKADTCGGLLDGLDLWLRSPNSLRTVFDPLCLIGPNGAGKSQLLQVIAEIFQSVFHATVGTEERVEGNPNLEFEIEYLLHPQEATQVHVRITRKADLKHKPAIIIQRKGDDGQWLDCDITDPRTPALLPRKVVGYTSGDNETLSLPFLLSRSGYAEDVRMRALSGSDRGLAIPDTRPRVSG